MFFANCPTATWTQFGEMLSWQFLSATKRGLNEDQLEMIAHKLFGKHCSHLLFSNFWSKHEDWKDKDKGWLYLTCDDLIDVVNVIQFTWLHLKVVQVNSLCNVICVQMCFLSQTRLSFLCLRSCAALTNQFLANECLFSTHLVLPGKQQQYDNCKVAWSKFSKVREFYV